MLTFSEDLNAQESSGDRFSMMYCIAQCFDIDKKPNNIFKKPGISDSPCFQCNYNPKTAKITTEIGKLVFYQKYKI
jgi:hypothetical protein